MRAYVLLSISWLCQNKVCISVVVGVDSPTLLLQISQNMPEKPVKE